MILDFVRVGKLDERGKIRSPGGSKYTPCEKYRSHILVVVRSDAYSCERLSYYNLTRRTSDTRHATTNCETIRTDTSYTAFHIVVMLILLAEL